VSSKGDDSPYTSGVLLISPQFVYLIAGLCSLYLAVAPFFTSFHGPITLFSVALWIGTVLLLIVSVLPSTRRTNLVALVGSTLTTVLLCYEIVRLVELKLGHFHGQARLVAYQPTMFDHVNQIVSKPVLLLFLISSVASLLISALPRVACQQRSALPRIEDLSIPLNTSATSHGQTDELLSAKTSN
jgi:hypothetical protein